MSGLIQIVQSGKVAGLTKLDQLYEWSEGRASLILVAVSFRGSKGSILCYTNPPVHQVGNPGLDAYLEALEILSQRSTEYSFLILYGANDPVHAGGDLKESLTKLDATITQKKELEAKGASAEEIDGLYDWGDKRLGKGCALYRSMRNLSKEMRVIAVCGGGTRYGGSAEIPLMADYLVGDSRSGMCFSEAMIGLIPAWSGAGRTVSKAGAINAKYMSMTGSEIKAHRLKEIGMYNLVVDIPFPFPKRKKTDNPEANKARYREALQKHDVGTGFLLLPKALELVVCAEGDIPVAKEDERLSLADEDALLAEIARRSNTATYKGLWGKQVKEVKEQLSTLGRPLAPQSVEALETLFFDSDPSRFVEEAFVEAEMKADARLYRDPRLRAGITAMLEQKVADFRDMGSLHETACSHK
jgi:enoyl-CoA hydratase/carnithine racemase